MGTNAFANGKKGAQKEVGRSRYFFHSMEGGFTLPNCHGPPPLFVSTNFTIVINSL